MLRQRHFFSVGSLFVLGLTIFAFQNCGQPNQTNYTTSSSHKAEAMILYASATNTQPGEKVTFSTAGGSGPYSYSIDRSDLATLDESQGILTALQAGTVTVTATDKLGASTSILVNIL